MDFVALAQAIGLEEPSEHVASASDFMLPADLDEIRTVARMPKTRLGRSAGLPTWDEPQGMH